MIRFIDIGYQNGPCASEAECTEVGWKREFAFFDTGEDKFEEFDYKQVWNTWEEFEASAHAYEAHEGCTVLLDLFRRLCPPWVFESTGVPSAS